MLALILGLPLAGAQPEASVGVELRIEDARGDVRVGNPSLNQSAGTSAHDHLDLEAVWLKPLDPSSFELGLQVVNPNEPPGLSQTLSRRFEFRFDFGTVTYRVTAPGFACAATLYSHDAEANLTRWRCLEAAWDLGAGILRIEVGRVFVVDQNGIPFQPGSTVSNFGVSALAGTQTGFLVAFVGMPVWAYDHAPDAGLVSYREPAPFEQEPGALSMTALDPIRVSNGESTTMVFKAFLSNAGDSEQTVLLSHETPEASFTIRTPARLVVAPRSTVEFPAILSMGFTHRHGEISTFYVHATSAADEALRTTLPLSVYWLETPQPAGHHDTLWLHAAPLEGRPFYPAYELQRAWFNPVREPESVEEPVARSYAAPEGDPVWVFSLDPTLGIGLDLDLKRQGYFRAEVKSVLPLSEAALNATVLYCDPTGRRPGAPSVYCGSGSTVSVVASGESTPTPLGANAFLGFEFEVAADPSADLIPYQKNANLLLQVRLQAETEYPAGPGPRPELRTASAELHLPLVEYHDPVDQAFRSVGALRLEPLGPFEKAANPGRTAVFLFRLTNEDPERQAVRVFVEGHNHAWASIVEAPELDLAPLASRDLALAVRIPDDASPGERAELFVVAESDSNPNVVAIARLRASVVDLDAMDVPDEAASLGREGDGSPGPGLAAVVALLGALAWGRRRAGR